MELSALGGVGEDERGGREGVQDVKETLKLEHRKRKLITSSENFKF